MVNGIFTYSSNQVLLLVAGSPICRLETKGGQMWSPEVLLIGGGQKCYPLEIRSNWISGRK